MLFKFYRDICYGDVLSESYDAEFFINIGELIVGQHNRYAERSVIKEFILFVCLCVSPFVTHWYHVRMTEPNECFVVILGLYNIVF